MKPTYESTFIFFLGWDPVLERCVCGREHVLGSGSGCQLNPECGMTGVRQSSFSHAQNQVHNPSASVWYESSEAIQSFTSLFRRGPSSLKFSHSYPHPFVPQHFSQNTFVAGVGESVVWYIASNEIWKHVYLAASEFTIAFALPESDSVWLGIFERLA